jgi:hypothetical protein
MQVTGRSEMDKIKNAIFFIVNEFCYETILIPDVRSKLLHPFQTSGTVSHIRLAIEKWNSQSNYNFIINIQLIIC